MKIVQVQRSIENDGYIIFTDTGAIAMAPVSAFESDEDFLSKLDGQVIDTVTKADRLVTLIKAATGDDIYAGVREELKAFTDLETIFEAKPEGVTVH